MIHSSSSSNSSRLSKQMSFFDLPPLKLSHGAIRISHSGISANAKDLRACKRRRECEKLKASLCYSPFINCGAQTHMHQLNEWNVNICECVCARVCVIKYCVYSQTKYIMLACCLLHISYSLARNLVNLISFFSVFTYNKIEQVENNKEKRTNHSDTANTV